MDYIPDTLTFLIAIIGLFGGTWNSNEKGLDKLNTIGRIALIILVASFSYSIFNTYQHRKNLQNEERQNAILASDIQMDVSADLNALLRPFRELYIDNTGGKYVEDEKITIKMLLQPSIIKKAEKSCLKEAPKNIIYPNHITWDDIFYGNISHGMHDLQKVTEKYSGDINPEMLNAIRNLEKKAILNNYSGKPPTEKETSDLISHIPPCSVGWPIDAAWPIGAYTQYLNLISAIAKLNTKDTVLRQKIN